MCEIVYKKGNILINSVKHIGSPKAIQVYSGKKLFKI